MKFPGVVFDIEGTLIDCVPQNLQSWQETLRTFDLDVPLSGLQRYSGMDADDMLQILAPGWDKETRKRAIKAQGSHYEEAYLSTVKPFPAVRDLFRIIKASGAKIAIATDCQGEPLKYYRKVLQADDLIDVIACGEDVGEGKPSPELISVALNKLSLTKDKAVMIGDTPSDAKAALGAGVASIGVLTGGFRTEQLTAAGCFHVAQQLIDVSPGLFGCPAELQNRR